MPPSRAVLVTGSSSGIGRATAERLAAHGWTVYATGRHREALAGLEARGCRVIDGVDVADEASLRAAVETVQANEGAVGVLVNNAGYSQSGAVEELSPDAIRRQFETNVFGLVRLCQLVLPGMRDQRWGKIVNLSSMGGRFTFPGGGAYHASKHAVEAFSDALRFEVAGFGVDVIVVEPGIIRTGFARAATTALSEVAVTDGPYGSFNRRVAEATRGVYEKGPLALLGGGPDRVARTIERAIAAEAPRARYRVTASARVLLTLRRLMSDRTWDRFLSSQFPRPGDAE